MTHSPPPDEAPAADAGLTPRQKRWFADMSLALQRGGAFPTGPAPQILARWLGQRPFADKLRRVERVAARQCETLLRLAAVHAARRLLEVAVGGKAAADTRRALADIVRLARATRPPRRPPPPAPPADGDVLPHEGEDPQTPGLVARLLADRDEP